MSKSLFENLEQNGSFFIRGEEFLSILEIELNVKHPKYSEIYNKISNLIHEAQKNEKSLVLSTSGL